MQARNDRSRRRPQAFMLVELLVVIGIIGAVIGLLQRAARKPGAKVGEQLINKELDKLLVRSGQRGFGK